MRARRTWPLGLLVVSAIVVMAQLVLYSYYRVQRLRDAYDVAEHLSGVSDSTLRAKKEELDQTLLQSKKVLESLARTSAHFSETEEGKVQLYILVNAVAELSEKVENIKESTLGLREAINPKNAEEILRTVRLADRVSEIDSIIRQTKKEQDERFSAFTRAVLREMDAANKSTTTILIILVPLVAHFLYQLWRDHRNLLWGKGDSAG